MLSIASFGLLSPRAAVRMAVDAPASSPLDVRTIGNYNFDQTSTRLSSGARSVQTQFESTGADCCMSTGAAPPRPGAWPGLLTYITTSCSR